MPSNFIHQRHAAYQTPPALLFALIRQTTGDEPSHSEKLVRGYDNEVYAVQTQQGHDYIVRIQQQVGAGYAEEQWAIERCRAVGVPVPVIEYVGSLALADQAKPVMVQRRVSGRPLADIYSTLSRAERIHIFSQVGAILSQIHSIQVGGFYKLRPDGRWDFPDWASIDQANRRDRTAERPYLQQAGLQEPEIDRLLALILAQRPPMDCQPVLCHADLGFDHLFVDARLTITGVIDFGEFQGGLPLVDFARLRLDCTDEEMGWVQAGYANQVLFADDFAQRLQRSRLNFLTGYLAHCVRIGDHEARLLVLNTLRAALQNEKLT